MHLSRIALLFFVAVLSLFSEVRAEDEAAENDDGGGGDGDDGAVDNYNSYNYYDNCEGDDCIKYWAGYAVYPKKCITYEGVDVIVFQVFENGYKQCSDTPMGTYITPVPNFVQAYLDQMAHNQNDMGNDDYQEPAASVYAQCTQYNGDNGQYSVMIGCSDDDSHSLSVNIYSDATCDTRDFENGMDDANIDVSDLQIPFHSCQACVTWLDKNDDEVDDQYYENKQINAPLCAQVWSRKQQCDRSCMKMAKEYQDTPHWSRSDLILLGILGVFAVCMMAGVITKRRQLTTKEDALLAADSSTKPTEPPMFTDVQLYIAFAIFAVLIAIFAVFVMKGLTWALLLGLNLALFGYLLKLVMESGSACSSPDDEDSDDEEDDEEPRSPIASGELT